MSKMDHPGILIGADPELFLVDQSGAFISGHDAVPGTKESPYLVEGGAVQVDGVAVEININPSETLREFLENLHTVVTRVHWMVGKSHPGSLLKATPTAIFDKRYFDDLPDFVKELGCSPDYNAYTGKANDKPHTDLPIRTGAGHVHLGWTEDVSMSDVGHFNDCLMTIKQMDFALFVPSHAWDKDNKRRMLYGNLGAFRPKPYGAEYRVLSNAWVNNKKVIPWLFNSIQHAYELLEDGNFLFEDTSLEKIVFKKHISDDDITKYQQALVDRGFDPLPEGL